MPDVEHLERRAESEKYLGLISREASRNSGISAEKIEKYLEDKYLLDISTRGSKKKRYAHKSHIKRLKKSGIISEDIVVRDKKSKFFNNNPA